MDSLERRACSRRRTFEYLILAVSVNSMKQILHYGNYSFFYDEDAPEVHHKLFVDRTIDSATIKKLETIGCELYRRVCGDDFNHIR